MISIQDALESHRSECCEKVPEIDIPSDRLVYYLGRLEWYIKHGRFDDAATFVDFMREECSETITHETTVHDLFGYKVATALEDNGYKTAGDVLNFDLSSSLYGFNVGWKKIVAEVQRRIRESLNEHRD